MIHADIEIASFEKSQQARAENFELLHAFREMAFERTLLLFEPGDVSVAEERYAIRREFDDLIDGVGKGFGGLVGKAVDQVDVYAFEAEVAGGLNQASGKFERLDAIDGFLN